MSGALESGAHIRYHGDFDWPGIGMVNQLVAMFGAQPWRMSADDYLDSPARLPLVGSEVAPAWDADLGAAMRHRGLAVHEEARSEEHTSELQSRQYLVCRLLLE